jgi:hypothetical protein|uniref:Uncharacterized protein n=1 Tax=viral metagenome TaxID=1070528 RepID=A0A6C0IKJ0_9ZZZZ
MNDLNSYLKELRDTIDTIKAKNTELKTDAQLEQLNDLLDGTDLAQKEDPSIFYDYLKTYKKKSNDFKSEFELGRQSEKILELKYNILTNNIEILRTYIRAERENLGDNINDMRNNEHFATTLNSDYSEIYKYKYLRNWGIFLSIMGGAYFLKKMK